MLNSTIPERRDRTNFVDIPPILRSNPLGSLASTVALPGSQRNRRDSQEPPPTQTLSSRDVYHEVQAAIRPILSTVQTQEQLSTLLDSLRNTQREQQDLMNEGRVRDPMVIRHKGAPRTARITSAREGPARGGGGARSLRARRSFPQPPPQQDEDEEDEEEDDQPDDEDHEQDMRSPPRKKVKTRVYRCGICHQEGHNRKKCPTLDKH
ncbi:hypothetical protein SCHPADRAFT_840630 [Schizopora paradoxa]|uniref:Uncharacterized protein n=1 Tax=Schizopora paradoxa TaxID=27342 RepID=A0A0H2QZK8_9AGAM|nr:hypothetical protein SCHPADRAFT_840630 [Schizopora paradoxa]